MPNARTANAVRLEFAPDSLVQSNLSGAAFTGDWLWVAGDEVPRVNQGEKSASIKVRTMAGAGGWRA
jgi:hypothetical protein